MPPLIDEIKDGQWLGVTVRSQGPGGKVLVCAHRYVRRGADFQWGQGLCYTLTQYLDYDESWEPCKGRPTNKAHEQYGYCQAGTSGVLMNDTAVIGTPGPYTWRGTMYVISVSDDFLNRDKTFYYSPHQEEDSPVDKYSYLGMSVTAANFFGNKLSYAAGAPRANGTGQVVLFVQQPPANPMSLQLILHGEQFASSFGYEITNADINGDTLPDLIVGAPFYFSREEGGAVYIFMNNAEHCLDCHEPIKLTGKPESRFGFAIANLGDLNKDGCDDIVVGAPYEDNGVVYIYLGSSNGIITTPAQIIKPQDLPVLNQPDKTFGYSLSGGLDLDQNGYPDLLIGAYEHDSVIVLRSRPIIGIVTTITPEKNLQNIDPNKQGCSKDPNSNHTCFTFNTCCYIESRVRLTRGSQNLNLNYSIEAEKFLGSNRKFSRVWFGSNSKGRPHSVKKSIILRPDSSRDGQLSHCEEETVYIAENTSDIQSPIKFLLTYSLNQREPRQVSPGSALPLIDDYPILNQQEATKTFKASFQKDCGDDICQSELLTEASLQLPTGREPNTWDLTLGDQKEVEMYVITNNFNESAYEAQLFISHPPSLTYISHIAENKRQTCIRTNNTLVVCSIGNPFKKGDVAKIILRFNPEGLEDYESHLKFVVFANSTSEEKKPQGPLELFTNVIRRAEVGLTGAVRPEQVFYGGEVKGEYAMEYRDDIGSRVLHSYQVTNKGPWRVSSLVVSIEWPFQVGNDKPQGKWLLYLDEKPIVESLVNYSSPMAALVLTDSSQLTALKSYQTKLCIPTLNQMICKNMCLIAVTSDSQHLGASRIFQVTCCNITPQSCACAPHLELPISPLLHDISSFSRSVNIIEACCCDLVRGGHSEVKQLGPSRSPSTRKRLHTVMEEMVLPVLELIQFVDTRWSSEYNMLSRLHAVRKAVGAELANSENNIEILTEVEWKQAAGIVEVLGPLADATKEINKALKSRFSFYDSDPIFCPSMLCDPRFRGVLIDDMVAVNTLAIEVKKLSDKSSLEPNVKDEHPSCSSSSSGLWSSFDSIPNTTQPAIDNNSEVKDYLNEPRVPISGGGKRVLENTLMSPRLWNSTLVEDYPKVNQVNITSRAKIHLPESLNIRQTNTQDDEAYVVTTAFPDLIDQQEPEAVPIWIIVVAVVAGLLLLILLTLVLWKLGFFKRRRPDPTLSGNLEKSHREDNGDYSS
uniref:Integrin alpha-2 domain-containing protein n=1 Tax=Timema shepardi TaxID=629360 RepID=A0A7R9FYI5_TIMSH|nr:unnamed protein product [Timema shepardi]